MSQPGPAQTSEPPPLPDGWRYTDDDRQDVGRGWRDAGRGWRDAGRGWRHPDMPSRWRRPVLSLAVVLLVLAAMLGLLVWNAADRYARGVQASRSGAHAWAMAEFASATVLGVPYRDARELEAQARSALQAQEADRRAEEDRIGGVVAALETTAARLDAGDAAGVLAALEAIPAGDLRSALLADEDAQQAADALVRGVAAAAETSLGRVEWRRAQRFVAALLVLEPSGDRAPALAERAQTLERLSLRMAEARDAARQGRWREALRIAQAVRAAQSGFPGAAALVADARAALRPAPARTREPSAAPTPDTGGTTTTTTPTTTQPPPP